MPIWRPMIDGSAPYRRRQRFSEMRIALRPWYHEVSPGSKSWPRSGRTPSKVSVLGVIEATVTPSGASPSVSA